MGQSDKAEQLHPAVARDDISGVRRSSLPQTADEWRQRLESRGEVGEDLELLLGAFERIETRNRLLSRMVEAFATLTESVPLGLGVLLDDEVYAANTALRELLHRDAGIRRAVHGGLEATDPALDTQLQNAIREVALGQVESAFLSFPRDDHGDLAIAVVSCGANVPGGVILAVDDGRKRAARNTEAFEALYGLTPGQARIAVHLALGSTAREIADELELGLETVRSHIKHILQRVGCNRQVDLVRHFVTGPLMIVAS